MDSLRKILLVEDDEFTRFMMKEIIDTLEVDVDIAVDGEICCDLVEQRANQYGLILMDIHMPNLSGVDATKKIRLSPNDPPKSLPIIAVTADEKYHDEVVIQSLGMDGFIAKPITAGELLGLVQRYC